ncbi:MAG: FAD-dependent oxidoreductase [Burkholderiales bacterium]
MKKLLLIGGGHSHVEVLRQFGLTPDPTIDITLVSPDRHTPYSGMLPGWIAGHYRFIDCHIDLERITRFARARFVQSRVPSIDRPRQQALVEDGSILGYDACSIDIGSTPPAGAIQGAREHAVPVKPVGRFIDTIESLASHARQGQRRSVAVIGAGAAGVEVLFSMQYRLLREVPASNLSFSLIAASSTVLPSHPDKVRNIFLRMLSERDVAVYTDFNVRSVGSGMVRAVDGREVHADFVVLATGAAAASWPAESNIETDSSGFIMVNEHLQSVSDPCLFAAGDIASATDHSYPKSGVYAVRQGPVLASNLRNVLTNRPLARYIPQQVALALISTGTRYAVASRGRWVFEGRWVWTWKDFIDRKFMGKYNRVPMR